jgi:dihydrofolate synthase / folylpolyglutamate synthase
VASPKTLPEWLSHLEALHPKGQAGIELGLDRVRAVKAALGQREDFPVIIVGGTNGKGSTCAYLETILDRAGCKVGCYASPHLIRYNERVRINTRPVDDAMLCRAFARVEAARSEIALTYFEFGTLAAWEVFVEAGVDVAVLEVGLGGRLDAVNAYEPDVSIVTGIALDHVDYLGPTREAIGFEKAGIFRHGKPAICADRHPPATLVDHAQAIGAEFMLIGRDFGAERIPEDRAQWRYWHKRDSASQETVHRNLAYPGLRGDVQIINAAAAITALDCLRDRLPMSMQAVRRGLVETELAGRFQVLPGRPAVVLDVGHNPQACEVLADNLGSMGFFDRTVAIVGMLADKDIEGSLQALAGKIDHWLVIPLASPRAAEVKQLAEVIAKVAPHANVECCANAGEAALRASSLLGETDRIVVFGSFLTVGAVAGDAAVLELLRQARRTPDAPSTRRLI